MAVRVGALEDLKSRGCLVVQGGRHGIAVFWHDGRSHAVDNRCPHLGFPLAKGTVKDGILTCHWHHWRFDLATGGCFVAGGEDVRVYPSWVRDGEVWVDVDGSETRDEILQKARADLQWALDHASTLRAGKSILHLLRHGGTRAEVIRATALYGARNREDWSTGMTILTCMANLLEQVELDRDGELLALVHGVREVANSCENRPPKRPRQALPGEAPERIFEWFRMFVEERQEAGAERCVLSAIEAGWDERRVAEMLYTAATDHFFLDEGHTIDFVTKAFELLGHIGWAHAADILPLLIKPLCTSKRYEEDTEWRYPFDFVSRLAASFARAPGSSTDVDGLARAILSEHPAEVVDALDGASTETIVRALRIAASDRLARFALRNEIFDWDTMHHAFTTAHAACEAAKFAPPEAIRRGLYHSAVKVYLVRFLTMPPARLPSELDPAAPPDSVAALHAAVSTKRVTDAAMALHATPRDAARRALFEALVREDAGFHDFQSVEAGVRMAEALGSVVPLVGAVRHLTIHSPTERFVSATVDKAIRLERGEDLAAE